MVVLFLMPFEWEEREAREGLMLWEVMVAFGLVCVCGNDFWRCCSWNSCCETYGKVMDQSWETGSTKDGHLIPCEDCCSVLTFFIIPFTLYHCKRLQAIL